MVGKRGVGLLLLVSVVGCAQTPEPRVERQLGGQRRVQPFVSPYAYEWYLRGELAAIRGDLEMAEVAFRRARTGPHDDPFVIARLAEVLEELDRPDEADRILAAGRSLEPRSEAVWMAQARIAEGRGETSKALAAYHQAEQAAPRSPEAPLALAHLLRTRGQDGRADAVLRRYVARAPSGSPGALRARLRIALDRGDASGALEVARRLREVAPARMGELRELAAATLEGGDPVMAARLLEAVPSSERPVELHVRALVAAGQQGHAEAVLHAAEAAHPLGDVALADLYRLSGRPDRALEIAEAAVVRQRTDPEAHRAAGEAALAAGRWVRAAEHFARVPPGVAASPAARQGLAEALRAAGMPHLAREVAKDAGDPR